MENSRTIKQISVFMENKAGRTNEITKVLAEHSINILAFSISESGDFGLLRLIVDKVEAACLVLKEARLAAILTDVVRVNCPNTTGSLTKVLEHLAKKNVSVDYMYAFQNESMSSAIIRPKDLNQCVEALEEYK
ncbi:MAG: ACT domain-containing protein [Bacteroidaceae bacterium]